jgi:hypothetical protein
MIREVLSISVIWQSNGTRVMKSKKKDIQNKNNVKDETVANKKI